LLFGDTNVRTYDAPARNVEVEGEDHKNGAGTHFEDKV